MTKVELKELLKELGSKASEVAGEIEERIEAEKAELDTETRRKVRAFWAPVGFVFGVLATLAFQWIF